MSLNLFIVAALYGVVGFWTAQTLDRHGSPLHWAINAALWPMWWLVGLYVVFSDWSLKR